MAENISGGKIEKATLDEDTKEVYNESYEEYYEEYVKSFEGAPYKKLLRKMDRHILPCLTVLYLVAHLDRANIGNAKIEGMEADLGMSGEDYNIITAVFFVSYILLEAPSNVILKRFFNHNPSVWIGLLCVSWGTIMTLHGVVQNFAGMIAARFFLGIAEAGFFPGAMLLISNWYLKFEVAGRVAIFYLASAFSGALSGLLAYGIAKMDGVGGYEGWRWIFILEGIVTVLVGVATFFVLPDTPEKSRWLTEDEVKYLRYRVMLHEGKTYTESNRFTWPIVKSVLLDWKLYVAGMIFWAASGPIYGIKFTLPEIITGMGYEAANAQLLSIPPYVVGGLSALLVSMISDKFKWRMPFIVAPLLVSVVGVSILMALAENISSNIGPCYLAICLMTAGYYPITPGINAWAANNIGGSVKRSLGLGYFVALGNCGSIAGSFMYLNEQKPKYPLGYGLSMAMTLWAALLAVLLDFVLWKLNKKKEKLSKAEIEALYSDEQLATMGDDSPYFKYTL